MTKSEILQAIDFQLFGIEMVFIDYRNYQNTIERFLKDEKEVLRKNYRSKISSLKSSENISYDNISMKFSERFIEISREFPHNFRASFLIQIIAFIEHELREICEHYAFLKQTKYSITDLKGNNDIHKAKQYLTKSCNVNFQNLNPEWQFILMAKKIRNKLVHHQGFVKREEKDWGVLIKFNNGKEYFDFSPSGDRAEMKRIILNSKVFIEDLLDNTESFFKKLIEKEITYKS